VVALTHIKNIFYEIVASGTFWLPPSASITTKYVDDLFYFILYLSLFFFVLVIATMIIFVVKYRKRSDHQRTSPIEGNRSLEIAWSLIPTVLLVVICVWGFRGFMGLSVPPRDAIEIRVSAQKWSWSFTYPLDGIVSPELVVPVDQPVKLIMSSQDVIHSFFVPAFRVKRDVLPNRYTVVWFEATETGDYHIFCTEYCGTGHSQMLSTVKVLPRVEYNSWLSSGGGVGGEGVSSAEFGAKLFANQGCVACHSVDGTRLVGPSLKGLFGRQEELVDGTKVNVDENYLRDSMMDPNAKVVKGFGPVMPSYKGRLQDPQIDALIDYIKSIGKDVK